MAVAVASSCSSHLIPSLGTSMCYGMILKKKKKKEKKRKMSCDSHAKEEHSQPGRNQNQPDSKVLSDELNKSWEIFLGTIIHIFPTSAAHCLSGVTLLSEERTLKVEPATCIIIHGNIIR